MLHHLKVSQAQFWIKSPDPGVSNGKVMQGITLKSVSVYRLNSVLGVFWPNMCSSSEGVQLWQGGRAVDVWTETDGGVGWSGVL